MTIPVRSQPQRRSASVSVPLLRTTGSGISTYTGMTSESMEARLLSQATSTATMAARSVLEAGGSEATALKTARAAAKSILNMEDDSHTNASTGFQVFRRRRSRRQAEVVASMALVSATNAVRHNNEWDILSGEQSAHALQARTLQTQQDMLRKGVTATASSSRGPPESPSLFSFGNSSIGRPPAAPNTPKLQRSSVQTEPTILERLSNAVASTKGSGSNGNGSTLTDTDSEKPSSIRVPPEVASLPTPEEPVISVITKDTPQKRNYLAKLISEHLSAEDPIYYQDLNNRGSNFTRERQTGTPATARAVGLHSQLSSGSDSVNESLYTSDNDIEQEEQYTSKHNAKKENFISSPFELLSFGQFFACGGGDRECDDDINARGMESEDDKDNSVTDGDHDDTEDEDDDEDDETQETSSSINSATILRELNHSSDIEDVVLPRRVDASTRKNARIVNDSRPENAITSSHQSRDELSSEKASSGEVRQELEVPLSDTGSVCKSQDPVTTSTTTNTSKEEVKEVEKADLDPTPPPTGATPTANKRSQRKGWILASRKNRPRSEI